MTGNVKELWRFPVKSMQGESLSTATITEYGVPGDRAYGLLDLATDRIVTAKKVRLFPNLMQCRATFVESPRPGHEAPAVVIRLPDGREVRSDDAAVDRVLSDYFDRAVRLVRAAPGIATDKQYRPDTQAAASAVDPATAGTGAFRDAYPTSLLTTATLARFGELQPGSRFEPRRFRMNIIVDTAQPPGFVENDWLDCTVGLGDDVRLNVAARDSRCVMTTLPQDDLPHDPEILRTAARHNRIHVAGSGDRPCAGVYAGVAVPGVVRVGDVVALR